MEDISNRTLALFLVAAIVVSVGGTILMLDSNKMGPTGYATEGAGNITLNIGETLAILMNDSSINFGTCELLPGTFTYVNSNSSETAYNNSQCSLNAGWNSSDEDFIRVRNYGNVDANITFTSNITEAAFFTGDTTEGDQSTLRYWSVNDVGCTGVSATPTEINSTGTSFPVCNSLIKSNGLIKVYADANINYDVTATSSNMGLTFLAVKAS